jgi:hypothetical protein
MYGTSGRLRFYLWCDNSSLLVDYAPPLSDYPEYPRDEGIEIFNDYYKSSLGSNYWVYHKGTSGYWKMSWVEVSDDCVSTFGMIVGSAVGYYPHIAIYEGPGIDGITTGSLLGITGTVLRGTYFCENDSWAPQENRFGLWTFNTNFRREA